MSKKRYKIGSMLKSKSGNYYLKFDDLLDGETITVKLADREVTLKKDDVIFLEKPDDEIRRLVEKDIISADQGEEKIAKVPDFVKFRIKSPNPKD